MKIESALISSSKKDFIHVANKMLRLFPNTNGYAIILSAVIVIVYQEREL